MRSLLITTLLYVLSASALAQDAANTRLAALEKELDASGYSGFFAVTRNGEPLYFGAAGAATADQPFTPDTQFDIGSIVKTITGLAASRLIADGKLASDAPITDFFEKVPADKRNITVHHLLTHGSGLPPAVGDDEEDIGRDEFVRRALKSRLRFEPGTGYHYSNVGFGLVAAIIEKVTDSDYETWVRANVLLPLDMKDTGYALAYDEARAERNKDGKSVREASWGGLKTAGWHLVGNGGMVSTARDMEKLSNAIANDTFGVGPLMLHPHNPEDDSGRSHYGYGIVVQKSQRFGQLYWHNGGNPWFYTDFFVATDGDFVVLVHKNDPDVDPPTGEVFGALVPEQEPE